MNFRDDPFCIISNLFKKEKKNITFPPRISSTDNMQSCRKNWAALEVAGSLATATTAWISFLSIKVEDDKM